MCYFRVFQDCSPKEQCITDMPYFLGAFSAHLSYMEDTKIAKCLIFLFFFHAFFFFLIYCIVILEKALTEILDYCMFSIFNAHLSLFHSCSYPLSSVLLFFEKTELYTLPLLLEAVLLQSPFLSSLTIIFTTKLLSLSFSLENL